MNTRIARVVTALALVAAAAASAGPGTGAGAQEADNRSSAAKVRIALNGYENNLTPFTLTFGSFPNTHDMINLVYDTLFWSQVKEDPEPWLAERATSSEDFKVWTVTLRSGVTWHDGRPFTAEDVKFSFDYYEQQAGSSGRYAHHVFDVPGLESSVVVDPRTVRFVFRTPSPQFEIMPGADLPIIPKHIWESVTEPNKATTQLPVGTGPYKLVEMVSDQRYRMQANEAYFKGRPTVTELELPIVRDPSAAFAALTTGEVDHVPRAVPPELMQQFERGTTGVRVAQSTKFESTQIYFNARKAPLSDPKLRKAISLAVDNRALVDNVLLGQARPGHDNFTHPDSPWALPGGRHEFDAQRANRMLDEAGYTKDPDGIRKSPEGTRLEFTVLVSSFEPQDLRAVQLMAQQLAPAGVRLTPEALDPATLRQRRGAPPGQVPGYDAYVSTLEAHGHVDPDHLYYFFHSPGKKGFGGSITGYGNARFDQLVERAAELGKEERKPLLHDAQRILAEEAPVVVLWYRDGDWAYRPAAYDGWVEDPGHAIFSKRSFLPDYVRTQGVANTGRDGGDGGGGSPVLPLVLAAAVIGGVAAIALARRRRTADETYD